MKGIILAGGYGTRLYPITICISKHLLPVYNKPLIYYPLSVLMLAGIREILIISTPEFISSYQKLFSDGKHLGISIQYEIQERPKGLADAFIVGRNFIGDDDVALILGDNIFFGQNFSEILKSAVRSLEGAIIFAHYVKEPRPFGVVEFDNSGKILSVEEKPEKPRSNYVITGLYFFTNEVITIASSISPSKRDELEITDILIEYLTREKLSAKILGRGMAWFDTGTPDSLLEASLFIEAIEKRQGLIIACIEEIAYNNGYIDKDSLRKIAHQIYQTSYGRYLLEISEYHPYPYFSRIK